MKKIKVSTLVFFVISIATIIFNACAPLREFGNTPDYKGNHPLTSDVPAFDSGKKTVVIIANNKGTELFDMMAPFYLFNATGKANVYIAAKERTPIVVKKGIFVQPQASFDQLDSMQIKPDLIVIPFLTAADSAQQDPVIIAWIRKQYSDKVIMLAICDGSATAAATGIYDGKPLTAHAADFAGIRANFNKPLWVQNVSFTNDGNLYSTAGVSNATEGSLAVITRMFGEEVMQRVIADVHYSSSTPKIEHRSQGFRFRDKLTIGKKILFRKDRKIGIMLQEGINKFELAAVTDTYNRTFPGSIQTFSVNDVPVKSKYGLVILPTGAKNKQNVDELHIIGQPLAPDLTGKQFENARMVVYPRSNQHYILETCFERIHDQYGARFEQVVKLMLDYN